MTFSAFEMNFGNPGNLKESDFKIKHALLDSIRSKLWSGATAMGISINKQTENKPSGNHEVKKNLIIQFHPRPMLIFSQLWNALTCGRCIWVLCSIRLGVWGPDTLFIRNWEAGIMRSGDLITKEMYRRKIKANYDQPRNMRAYYVFKTLTRASSGEWE